MARPRKILLAATMLAALVLLALFALPRLVRVDSLRPDLETRLSSALGRPVTLGTLRLSVGAGIALSADGLRIGELTPGAPTFAARTVRVRVALIPLLRRRLVARSFLLESGTLRDDSGILVSNVRVEGRFEANPEGEVRSSGSMTGRVEALPGDPDAALDFAVALREGRLIVESSSGVIGPLALDARGEIAGLRTGSLRARLEGTGGIGESRFAGSVAGELRDGAPKARFELTSDALDVGRIRGVPAGGSHERSLVLQHLAARGVLEANELRCADATFELYGGSHRGTFALQPFDETLPFELDSHLAGVSVERLGAALAPERAATLQGTGDLDLSLRGRAPGGRADASSLTGSARLVVRDGTVASIGVLRQIGRLLESAGRGAGPEDTPFRTMSATFEIQGGAGRTDDLAVRSDDLDLDGHGTVGLDGALDLDLLVSFSKEASRGLVERNSRLRFRVGPDGRLSVPLKMAGSLSTPEIRLDVDRVLSEGVERILEDKKKGLLKKLLGGR